MKNIILFLVSFLILTAPVLASELILTDAEKVWLQNHPTIKVSNENDWPPFDFAVDGEAKGYSVDIIKNLAKKIGIEVKFVNGYSWSELIEEFDKKNIDLMHVMNKNKQREAKYNFSEPYMPWRLSYLIRDDEKNINSTKDFDGKKIAAGEGWSTTKLLRELYPKATVIGYKNSSKMLEALAASKVDIAIDSILALNYTMSQDIITNVKHAGYIDIKDKGINNFYFVSQKDFPELVSIFNKAYKLFTIEEKINLQKKWFGSVENKSIILTQENLTNKEKEYLKKKKRITMCIDPDWMPFEKFDKNGKHVGMTSDYFKVFQKDIGIPIEAIKTNSWTESLQAAKKRECDIFSLAMETKERKKYMNFTTPYLSVPLVLATRLDVGFIDDIRYIKKEKIGIVKGYAFNEIIRREYPDIEVVDVENLKEGLQKVANGELFGFIDTLATIGYTFQKNFIGELKIAGKFPEKWELGIGVRNDDAMLLNIFEKSILSLSPEMKQTIFSKHVAIKYEKMTDYSLLIKVLITGFIIGAFGLFHNRKLYRINHELRVLKEKLQKQADKDPLTNLYNRRYFHNIADNILNISFRDKKNVGVIMIDIDFFKKVNDTYGHNVGDIVIKKLANLLLADTRKSDIVARFGGEEFVVLLPDTNKEGSLKIAQKLREIVEKEIIKIDDEKTFSFTISLGVTTILLKDKNIEPSLDRADKALYIAKENGRNQVVAY